MQIAGWAARHIRGGGVDGHQHQEGGYLSGKRRLDYLEQNREEG